MKKTALKRKTQLKSYTTLKTKTPLKAKKSLNKISKKQNLEIKKRSKLKRELIKEYGNHCMTCKDLKRDWRGLTLSHVVPLSRGGLTEKKNCLIECFVCHEFYEKHPEKRQQIYPYTIDI